jgi:hypothetical protein
MNHKLKTAIKSLDLGIDINALDTVFNAMEIAEDEIDRAMRLYPESKNAIWNAFKMLQMPAIFRGKSDKLYRAYCRELLARVAKGEDVRPATDAELIVNIAEASLAAPPTRTAGYLYMTLFHKIFGSEAYDDLGLDDGAKYMIVPQSAVDELHGTLRNKGAVDERALKQKDEWRDVPAHRMP